MRGDHGAPIAGLAALERRHHSAAVRGQTADGRSAEMGSVLRNLIVEIGMADQHFARGRPAKWVRSRGRSFDDDHRSDPLSPAASLASRGEAASGTTGSLDSPDVGRLLMRVLHGLATSGCEQTAVARSGCFVYKLASCLLEGKWHSSPRRLCAALPIQAERYPGNASNAGSGPGRMSVALRVAHKTGSGSDQ